MISNKSPVLRAPNGPAKSGLYHNLDVGPSCCQQLGGSTHDLSDQDQCQWTPASWNL